MTIQGCADARSPAALYSTVCLPFVRSRLTQCDDYMVPNKRPPSARGEANDPIAINDERMPGMIEVSDSKGLIVERIEAPRFRF